MRIRGELLFFLGIPIASSLGGMGTPVGTTTNGIALKFLPPGQDVSFLGWMVVAVPYVVFLLIFAWFLLRFLFPPTLKVVTLEFGRDPLPPHADGKSFKSRTIIVYVVFLATIALWLTSKIHGINIYTVALLPVAAFLATGVIEKADLKKMSWDVLWLIAGGIALGEGLLKTGLTEALLKAVPFQEISPVIVILGVNLITVTLATIMSHTATANLIIPVIASVAPQISGLGQWGGPTMLLVSVGVTCSLGMALPISTPCNALAFSAGGLTNKQMLKAGLPMTVVGLLLAYGIIFVLGPHL
jgi:sodium-dependent dicarboxylate transporter 2/3/5